MAVRPPELTYAVDEWPPWQRLIPLGFQFAILGTVNLFLLVIIAHAAGADKEVARNVISLGLVAIAVGTVLQAHYGRLVGSGYLVPLVFSAIYLGPALLAAKTGGMPAVAGMTIFAGVLEIILSRVLHRMRVIIQPTISGFIVLVVGVQLGLVGISHLLDVSGEGTPVFARNVGNGLLTLGVCVIFAVWGRGVWRLLCTLIGLVAGMALGFFDGLIGPPWIASVKAAPWVAVPDPSFLSYSFHPTLVPAFVTAALAATLRAVGVITTAQRINDAAWKRPDIPNIQRGVLADGIGCTIGGLLGLSGMSAAPSTVSVSAAIGTTSRAIAYAMSAFIFIFAFVPKFSAAIVGLPLEIAGALLTFLAVFMITGGLQVLTSRAMDVRTSLTVSFALLLGLSTQLNPEYFHRLPEAIRNIASDMLTVSLVTAIAMTLLFRFGIRRREKMNWEESDASIEKFQEFLKKQSENWKVADDVVDRANFAVRDVFDHLKSDNSLDEPITIQTDYDGLELRVELDYRGRVPKALGSMRQHEAAHVRNGQAHPKALEHATAHEDAAVTSGLDRYHEGVFADRCDINVSNNTVMIRLRFDA